MLATNPQISQEYVAEAGIGFSWFEKCHFSVWIFRKKCGLQMGPMLTLVTMSYATTSLHVWEKHVYCMYFYTIDCI